MDEKNRTKKFHSKNYVMFGTPTDHIQSEGDRMIKNLVLKQTNTNVDLQTELLQKKEFKKSIDLVPITNRVSGTITFKEFKKCQDLLNLSETLTSYRLNSQQINIYLDYQKGEQFVFDKYKNLSKDSINKTVNEINNTILENSTKIDSNTKDSSVSRHLKDLALCVKPDSEETKLYQFALSCSSNTNKYSMPDAHPINHLKEIQSELFSHINDKPSTSIVNIKEPIKKKRKKISKTTTKDDYLPKVKYSKWDIKQEDSNSDCEETVIKKTYSCQKPRYYTIINSKIVELNDVHVVNDNADRNRQEFSAEKFSKKTETNEIDKFNVSIQNFDNFDLSNFKKLSEEEIKQISHFKNYEKGTPSKVLYIKNLNKRTKESDLMKIFNNFNKNNSLVCKLLNGRMTGQAFVTFASVHEASLALEELNGVLINNKPVIINYSISK